MINIDVAPCPAPATGEPPLGRGDENAEGCVRLAAQNLDKAKIEAECYGSPKPRKGHRILVCSRDWSCKHVYQIDRDNRTGDNVVVFGRTRK